MDAVEIVLISEPERLIPSLAHRLAFRPAGAILPVALSAREIEQVLQLLNGRVLIDDDPPRVPTVVMFAVIEVIGDRPLWETRDWLRFAGLRRGSELIGNNRGQSDD